MGRKTLSVREHNNNVDSGMPRAGAAVPGGAGLTMSTAGSGGNDDVNGNGRIDFADVVWLFNNL